MASTAIVEAAAAIVEAVIVEASATIVEAARSRSIKADLARGEAWRDRMAAKCARKAAKRVVADARAAYETDKSDEARAYYVETIRYVMFTNAMFAKATKAHADANNAFKAAWYALSALDDAEGQ